MRFGLPGDCDIFGLQALVAFAYQEVNTLPVTQDPVSLAPNRPEMNENVVTGIPGYETKAFIGVNPFYGAQFTRVFSGGHT